MIKIVIIADPDRGQVCLRDYLSTQRDFKILGLGKDGYDALKLVNTCKPDIVLIDVYRDDINGMEITPLLRSKSPSTRTIILTSFEDEDHICKALSNRISGYLLRNADYERIAESIRTIYRGGIFYTPKIAAKVFALASEMVKRSAIPWRYPREEKITIPPTISEIELRIISLIGEGRSVKEIAENLNLKPGTIRNYISSAMHKAGLRNRSEIALYALKKGLIVLSGFWG
jgi:DNA-binding NarL/FixJ family response regulator